MKKTLNYIFDSVLFSYSKVFFAENRLLGLILLVISFFNWWAGLMGILSVLTVIALSTVLKYDENLIRNGSYGFNALLVGLGIGWYFPASFYIALLTVLFAILTFFLTLAFQGILMKYGLPYLSLPFLFSMWIASLSIFSLSYLGVSERGIYIGNELYSLGGDKLLNFYYALEAIEIPRFWQTYFLSMGAIFFQLSILAGFLISIGLLIYSRIAFLLSVVGFAIAYYVFDWLHIDMTQLSYTYIGFNFILTSVAVGGYYVIPSKSSFASLLVLMPVSVFIALAGLKIFSQFHLSLYSLPFNIVVLLFLYALKFRKNYISAGLIEPLYPKATPEHTLYDFQNNLQRFYSLNYFPVNLPFNGVWYVSQGHNGVYTHKGDWRFAWDFVQVDENLQQFKGSGDSLEDYFCYGKSVIAPASGTVVKVIDEVADNPVGKVNIRQNWGNVIVIQHTQTLFSLLAHLKKGSIKVKEGQFVKEGQVLAQVGNSGRSPYPHLHFQLQATPYVGSPTIDYPLAYYFSKTNDKFVFKNFQKPQEGEFVSNLIGNDLIARFFDFSPGRNLEVKILHSNLKMPEELIWQIQTTPANIPFIYCPHSGSKAFFTFNDKLFYFTDFSGSKKSLLHYFYLSFYKVIFSFYKDVEVSDPVPVYQILNHRFLLAVQDFIAPFYLFTQGKFTLKYIDQEFDFDDEKLVLRSEVKLKTMKKEFDYLQSEMEIHSGFLIWKIKTKKATFEVKIN